MEIYDEFLKTKMQAYMATEEEEYARGRKQKDSFWPSETEKPLFDIYHQWFSTPPTNPIEPEKLIMFSFAKMAEVAFINKMVKMGLVRDTKEQEHFVIQREGVTISGYTDGIFTDGTPLELKSFYGDYTIRELKAGKPKTANLKQLACYMDSRDQEKGKLVYLDRGTGEMYEFTLLRTGETTYKCLTTEFDLMDTYKRWSRFYEENILKEKEPDYFECGKYKEDLASIDWSKIRKSDITKARNNRKVIGSNRERGWQIQYSPWKNLVIAKQGSFPGYSEAELEIIRKATAGYSKK